jgi:hypothetical protein
MGPLWLCSHSLPYGHGRELGLPTLEEARLDPMVQGIPDEIVLALGCQPRIPPQSDMPSPQHHLRESILEWRSLAARAAAILRLSSTLAKGKAGSAKDWAMARNGLDGADPLWRRAFPIAADPMHRRHRGSTRDCMLVEDYRRTVDVFAAITGVRPGLSGRLELSLDQGDGHGLTRAIGAQLVKAAAASFVAARARADLEEDGASLSDGPGAARETAPRSASRSPRTRPSVARSPDEARKSRHPSSSAAGDASAPRGPGISWTGRLIRLSTPYDWVACSPSLA